MSETVMLKVVEQDHPRYGKQYLMEFRGREFGLATYPEFSYESSYNFYTPRRGAARYRVSFDVYELPPEPKPKPKRTWARSMGLRKPK